MTRLVKLFLVTGLTGLLLSGVSDAGPRRGTPAAERRISGWAAPPTPVGAQPLPLVWVADGAGDFKGCSTALTNANRLSGNPFELSVFPWSHGYGRVRLDQTDWEHAKRQGERLAATIRTRKEREPGRRVVLVAHSAGCAVALAAGDALPPDSIDRTILLAPSVSTGYDLRPSLLAAREGLDVFCSRKDWLALGIGVRLAGTADNGSGPAAGRRGFRLPAEFVLDPVASGRLRQHFWSAEQAWTGHTGGHYGMHSPAFVRAYLFPLFG